jgi:hypothetical protein
MTFARKLQEQREKREAERMANLAHLMTQSPRINRGTYSGSTGAAVPKVLPVRDEGYRRLVAALPCIRCGIEGRSQCAHANQGKGMATKASDENVFPLCFECHQMLDQSGQWPKDVRRAMEAAWVEATKIQLEGIK